jgi:hypothetical protein
VSELKIAGEIYFEILLGNIVTKQRQIISSDRHTPGKNVTVDDLLKIETKGLPDGLYHAFFVASAESVSDFYDYEIAVKSYDMTEQEAFATTMKIKSKRRPDLTGKTMLYLVHYASDYLRWLVYEYEPSWRTWSTSLMIEAAKKTLAAYGYPGCDPNEPEVG